MKNFRKVTCNRCGNCKHFQRFYEISYCHHPNNPTDAMSDERVWDPWEDDVCDEWEAIQEKDSDD